MRILGRVAHGTNTSLRLFLPRAQSPSLNLHPPRLSQTLALVPFPGAYNHQNVQALNNRPWFSPTISQRVNMFSQPLSLRSSPWVLPSSPPPPYSPGSTPQLSSGRAVPPLLMSSSLVLKPTSPSTRSPPNWMLELLSLPSPSTVRYISSRARFAGGVDVNSFYRACNLQYHIHFW